VWEDRFNPARIDWSTTGFGELSDDSWPLLSYGFTADDLIDSTLEIQLTMESADPDCPVREESVLISYFYSDFLDALDTIRYCLHDEAEPLTLDLPFTVWADDRGRPMGAVGPVPNTDRLGIQTFYVRRDHPSCPGPWQEQVVIVECGPTFYVPEVIHPFGVEKTQRFFVQGHNADQYRVERMEVFNRWGGLIFYAEDQKLNDASSGWDGHFNGEPVAPGVYVYQIRLVDTFGNVVFLEGDITVLR